MRLLDAIDADNGDDMSWGLGIVAALIIATAIVLAVIDWIGRRRP